MKTGKFILLFHLLLCMRLYAQLRPCATVLNNEQQAWLRQFQQTLTYPITGHSSFSKKYIPLTIHLVGSDKGTDFYNLSYLADNLCRLNKDFAATGFCFYIKDSIRYINNSKLYNTLPEEIDTVTQQLKDPGAVNIFFAGSSSAYGGIYIPELDVVYVINSFAKLNPTTCQHELGHFFGLPHTFNGWEYGVPPPEQQERADGSNCLTAGDGFCDTRADYLARGWYCTAWLTDSTGTAFTPDSSLFMNYADNTCKNRFSPAQMAAMQANLSQRAGLANQAFIETYPDKPVLIYPPPSDSSQTAERVTFSWKRSPGAFAWHLQVTRSNYWGVSEINTFIYDTFYISALREGDYLFDWRVKALSRNSFCGEFSEVSHFYAKNDISGHSEISPEKFGDMYPNPVKAREQIRIPHALGSEVIITDAWGRSIGVKKVTAEGFRIDQPGMYMVKVTSGNQRMVLKLIVVE